MTSGPLCISGKCVSSAKMANKEVINATDLISILLTSTCFAELASSTQFAGYLEHLAEQQAFLELTARPFGMQKARQATESPEDEGKFEAAERLR